MHFLVLISKVFSKKRDYRSPVIFVLLIGSLVPPLLNSNFNVLAFKVLEVLIPEG